MNWKAFNRKHIGAAAIVRSSNPEHRDAAATVHSRGNGRKGRGGGFKKTDQTAEKGHVGPDPTKEHRTTGTVVNTSVIVNECRCTLFLTPRYAEKNKALEDTSPAYLRQSTVSNPSGTLLVLLNTTDRINSTWRAFSIHRFISSFFPPPPPPFETRTSPLWRVHLHSPPCDSP